MSLNPRQGVPLPKFENPVIRELLDRYRRLWALNHAMALMGWDEETYMPQRGVEERAVATAELRALYQELLLSDQFSSLVEKAKAQENLNDYERGVVRVVDRELRIARRVPPSLTYEMAKTSSEAFVAWSEAKKRSDFSAFRPYLQKLIDLNRQMAEKLGYEEVPYDALLDLYEEGLRTRDVKAIFDVLGPGLRGLLDKVISDGYYTKPSPLEEARYDEQAMRRVNAKVLELLSFPQDRARLDVSPHPFTTNMGVNDVRITTRYEGFDFKRSLFSVVHEFGHATYELQVDPELAMTPIGGGVSLGVHEGQSRFWENVVGRSRAFASLIKPVLDQELGLTKDLSEEDVYRYFATVRPSLIRTEADEVTYNLHILLRFELEQLMINGEVRVDDLPEMWNEESEKLIGVRPRNHAEGILQDVHWAHGTIGYFPTYTLGNIVASMMYFAFRSRVGDIYERVAKGDFESIKAFQRELIHRYGGTYAPKELLRRQLGEEYNASRLLDYLSSKYLTR
jgi:carboxypeptidase Taq